MFNKIYIVGLASAIIATPVLAEDYVVDVNGIVCDFCAYGVAKKVSKLPFIDNSRFDNGVDVDIENQIVTVAVRDGEKLDQDKLFSAIRSAGYDPIAIRAATADIDEHESPQ
ncbi:MAG: heavy-metal-associated domain-containing protein [Woeseiaceae bacterium]|nr:heavy-metal-associated domain-containing protein [Woeseiaceae bacterium]